MAVFAVTALVVIVTAVVALTPAGISHTARLHFPPYCTTRKNIVGCQLPPYVIQETGEP